MPVRRWNKVAEALGLRRSMVGLLSMAVLVGMGERMAERFLPIYLLALGSGMYWPGLLNGLNDVLGALYAFPGGWLADRIGVKRSLLVFNLLAIAGFALVVAIPNWRAVVIGSFLFLSWSAISLPGTMGLVSKSLPKQKHVMGVSLHSLVRRIPMALGPVIGGIFIDAWGPATAAGRAAPGWGWVWGRGGRVGRVVGPLGEETVVGEEEKTPPPNPHPHTSARS